eukprot:CAMPEP_0194078558 /NCGR_PEP_ID=MMETSP0149-20130528/4920_1 /TAXON_ID=122233 /ORGANISM="Chaetoceros debilis, Strain MM31A-1" /LENGTH=874 /DNA_ID=CAMNT_0038759845 /DNA_START=139 /DNA_END=2763 /DNA_ORIENTATION=+
MTFTSSIINNKSGISINTLIIFVAILLQSASFSDGINYLPGIGPKSFNEGEVVNLKVDKLTSSNFKYGIHYYDLPFCQPPGGIQSTSENLSELLHTTDQSSPIQNSPYHLQFRHDTYCQQLCIQNLGRREGRRISPSKTVRAIQKQYHVNWIVDSLPSISGLEDIYGETQYEVGFPMGFVYEGKSYINNHVNIILEYHEVDRDSGSGGSTGSGSDAAAEPFATKAVKRLRRWLLNREDDDNGEEEENLNEEGDDGVAPEEKEYRIVKFRVEPLSINHRFRRETGDKNGNHDDDDDGTTKDVSIPHKIPIVANITHPIPSCDPSIPPSSPLKRHTSYDMVFGEHHIDGPTGPQPASRKALFTYDVIWVENTETTWVSRWDVYLNLHDAEDLVGEEGPHWLSVSNSLIILVMFSAIVIAILVHHLKKDYDVYMRIQQMNDDAAEMALSKGTSSVGGVGIEMSTDAEIDLEQDGEECIHHIGVPLKVRSRSPHPLNKYQKQKQKKRQNQKHHHPQHRQYYHHKYRNGHAHGNMDDDHSYAHTHSHNRTIHFGWTLIQSDVFRAPSHPMAFSILCGTGVQLLGMSFLTIIFCTLGSFNPAEEREALVLILIILYVVCGAVAGYVMARLYKTFGASKNQWRRATIILSLGFPSGVFVFVSMLNFLALKQAQSHEGVTFERIVLYLALWLGVSTPLVCLGSKYGYQMCQEYQFPVNTSMIPRQIPDQPWFMGTVVTSGLASLVSFGACFLELSYLMSSIWVDEYYYVFGFLFLTFFCLIATCAEITVLVNYFQLRCEDYRWWWRSFTVGGSVAFYIFVYALFYATRLQSTNAVSFIFYFGYMGLSSICLCLMTGTVGVFSSFYFNHKMYQVYVSKSLKLS